MMNNTCSKHRFKGDILLLFTLSLISLNCSKLIQVDAPYTSVNAENVFDNAETANSALIYLFTQMSQGNGDVGGNNSNLFLYSGLAGDELTLFAIDNSSYAPFYFNALSQNSNNGFWDPSYNLIFIANQAMEGLNSNNKLTNDVKQQLLGEAKFIRAFCYFYLVNLYGNIPLPLGTDPLKNAVLKRVSVDSVYSQIINDLIDAQSLLSDNYRSADGLSSSNERTRPNKWAAKALLARVYLYHKNYSSAIAASTDVINETSLFNLDSLNEVFLIGSRESIWQLQNVNNSRGNTFEGNLFILPDTGPNSTFPVYLSHFLLNSFEPNDQRKKHWIDSVKIDTIIYHFAYKYKTGVSTPDGTQQEYETVLRLGEQFLIRAEANASLGNIQAAEDDLNIIRIRAGLNSITNYSKDDLLSAILHERQVELFTEWGHRWFDLKRNNKIDQVMGVVALEKGVSWSPNWALWPLYLNELQTDPFLTQNAGY